MVPGEIYPLPPSSPLPCTWQWSSGGPFLTSQGNEYYDRKGVPGAQEWEGLGGGGGTGNHTQGIGECCVGVSSLRELYPPSPPYL